MNRHVRQNEAVHLREVEQEVCNSAGVMCHGWVIRFDGVTVENERRDLLPRLKAPGKRPG